ncbi:MAG: hypothetical protein ED554_05670 [Synechococcus sp. YX04-3]|nr:MAG: hypothetical protein ED554_05670 [Synechococcus sp. YX04-3]
MTRFSDTFLHSLIALTIPLLERQKVINSTLIHLTLNSLLKLLRFPIQSGSTEMRDVLRQELSAIPTRHSVCRHRS